MVSFRCVLHGEDLVCKTISDHIYSLHPHGSDYLTWMVVATFLSSMLASALVNLLLWSMLQICFPICILSFESNVSLDMNSTFTEYYVSLLGFPSLFSFPFVSVLLPDAAKCNIYGCRGMANIILPLPSRTLLLFRSTHKTTTIHHFCVCTPKQPFHIWKIWYNIVSTTVVIFWDLSFI